MIWVQLKKIYLYIYDITLMKCIMYGICGINVMSENINTKDDNFSSHARVRS